MAKYSQAFKLRVVQYYLSGHGGYRSIAAYFNIDHDTVRKWLAIYDLHGEQGLLRQTTKQKYSIEFKHKVVLSLINDGLSSREVVKKFKLKERQMVRCWLRQYQEHGIDGLKPKPRGRSKLMPRIKVSQEDRNKTQEQIFEELAYLRAEVALLKKRRALRQEQEAKDAAEQQRLQN